MLSLRRLIDLEFGRDYMDVIATKIWFWMLLANSKPHPLAPSPQAVYQTTLLRI